ncbi:hypothetical protein EYF80_004818 [Liparis tanakae]|uniref:Uncharacterized protein n=1 Tax=Liparis tanakae TaxID=230148 RepID=A0A4Z2J5H5_9TELE|nr:hypothetical protein EYF80_004818 [Liparis tanakae]
MERLGRSLLGNPAVRVHPRWRVLTEVCRHLVVKLCSSSKPEYCECLSRLKPTLWNSATFESPSHH